jgi:hypothetical protein
VSRVLEWALRIWAGLLVVAAALWVLGPYGAGVVFGSHLMRWPFRPLLNGGPLEGLLTGPVFAADLAEESARDAVMELGQRLTASYGQPAGDAFGDINLGWSVQFTSMGGLQQTAFVVLHVVPLLVMAALWWSLASVVRQSRSESVFTNANARRLTVAGLVIAVGAPLLSVASWGLHRWIVSTSQLADRVVVPEFGIDFVPWTAVAAGLALLVLGTVWRRGVLIQRDLAGLV